MVHTGGHSSSVEWRKKDPATAVLEGLEVVWEACLLFWGVQAAHLFVRGTLSPMRRQQVPPPEPASPRTFDLHAESIFASANPGSR